MINKIFFAAVTTMFVNGAFAQSVVFKQNPIAPSLMAEEESAEDAIFSAAMQPKDSVTVEPERPKPVVLYGGKNKIVALVNNEIISSHDLQSAINMFVINAGIPYENKTKDMITHRVMQELIDEKLKIAEAKKQGVKVENNEIQKAIANFAIANKIPLEKLEAVLSRDGINISGLRAKIEADSVWQKLISKRLGSMSPIGLSEVKKEKAAIEKDLQKARFAVSEIVIPAKNSKDIYSLVSVLREDPRFELYAMQFSESASASRGGDLGWVNKENLDSKMAQNLEKTEIGGVTDPVRIGNKYYIMKLNGKYNPKNDKSATPSDDDVLKYLQNKKADEVINRYTQELRNRAIIEIRE